MMAQALPAKDNFGNPMLKDIEEIQLPPAIDLWPSAPGWDYIMALVILGLVYYGYQKFKQWWHDRYRRLALQQLDDISSDQMPLSKRMLAMAELLKSVALYVYPRAEVAFLSGDSWLDYLNAQGEREFFNVSDKLILGKAIYESSPTIQEPAVDNLSQRIAYWIKYHPVPGDVSGEQS